MSHQTSDHHSGQMGSRSDAPDSRQQGYSVDSESVPGSQVAWAYSSWGQVSEWFQKIDVLGLSLRCRS